MSTYSAATRTALVRHDYSEESTWRAALGPLEPLHVFATDGTLDAREHLPAGSMRACRLGGPMPSVATRDD